RGKGLRYRARGRNSDVDVAALQTAAGQVGRIGGPDTQPFDGRSLVAERFQEGEGVLFRIKGLFREAGNSFLDFNRIHLLRLPPASTTASESSCALQAIADAKPTCFRL